MGVKLKEITSPVINDDLAYLCGIFAGDGSISIRKHKNEYLLKCVGNPKDEISFYNEIISPIFQAVFGFSPVLKYCDSRRSYGFIIYSKALITFLTTKIGLPIGKKYDSLNIPLVFKDNKSFLISFIRGVFDTDGCISFKKKYRTYPYYPVISFSSKSESFVREIAFYLKQEGFKLSELYNYKVIDKRLEQGYTTISRIDLNGQYNLEHWITLIGFKSPKHNTKIKRFREE